MWNLVNGFHGFDWTPSAKIEKSSITVYVRYRRVDMEKCPVSLTAAMQVVGGAVHRLVGSINFFCCLFI